MRVLAVVVVMSGCMPAAPPAVRATGERLGVSHDTRVELKPVRIQTDPLLGNSHEWVLQMNSHPTWFPLQGDTRIPDEDFFVIAGDPAALDATRRLHARGVRWNQRGKLAMAGGLVVAIGGYFVPNTALRSVTISAGVLGIGAGVAIAVWGSRQLEPEAHAVDPSVAERAARRYNEQHGLSLARRF